MTIRPSMFSPIKNIENSNLEKIEKIDKTEILNLNNIKKLISYNTSKSLLPDLSTAKIVISGGRAFKNKENFEKLYILGKKLNAASINISKNVINIHSWCIKSCC